MNVIVFPLYSENITVDVIMRIQHKESVFNKSLGIFDLNYMVAVAVNILGSFLIERIFKLGISP